MAKAEAERFRSWTEDETKIASEFFETPLEFEKYLVDPKNEKNWLDINKDLSLGNLEQWEHGAILNQEKTLRGLMGMKDSLGNKTIGELFVPNDLLKLYKRMPAFTLAISLSKNGFKQKLMRSYSRENILKTPRDPDEEVAYKSPWSWKRKNKNKEVE